MVKQNKPKINSKNISEEEIDKIKFHIDSLKFMVCSSVARNFEDLADMRRTIDSINLELAELLIK